MKHYLHPTLLAADGHAVTVDLIGAGGTGSALLTHLARLHISLQARGHLGLHVRVFDGDVVEQANLVRQHFTLHDLGRNKATAAVERLNRHYGLNWQAIPLRWDEKWVAGHPGSPYPFANITISCVDTVAARNVIWKAARRPPPQWARCFAEDGSVNQLKTRTPAHQQLYWLDIGNARDFGQVVLATFGHLPQPVSHGQGEKWGITDIPALRRLHPGDELPQLVGEPWNGYLPSLFDMHGELEQFEDEAEQGPSCSLIEALSRQSLMVNPMMATAAANLLAQMFERKSLFYHGCYVNLNSLTSTPIPIPQPVIYERRPTKTDPKQTIRRHGVALGHRDSQPNTGVLSHQRQ